MKATPRKTLQFPAIGDFELTFYISESSEESKPRIFPRHMHDAIEILILLQGECSFSIESDLYSMQAGDAVIISPNEAHNCILHNQTFFHHLCLQLTPTQDGIFDNFLSFHTSHRRFVHLNQQALSRVTEISKELEGPTIRLQRTYLTMELLWLVQSSQPAENASTIKMPAVLQQILTDIGENFQKIDRLEYLTEAYFISPSTLGRLFRTYLHTTPKQYLETKRLACSRILLKQGYNVYDACAAAGFPDYSNYIRLFHRRFGMTPKQYQSSPSFEIFLTRSEDTSQ